LSVFSVTCGIPSFGFLTLLTYCSNHVVQECVGRCVISYCRLGIALDVSLPPEAEYLGLISFREPIQKRSVSFNWGSAKVRGLNIGGWLVLEPWITPSIFQNLDQSLGIVDEYTLTQKLGTTAAYNILKPHWDSWCTFTDFQKIANAGFNTVRIPIGYWAYSLDSGEPYTQGAAPYIDAAVDWARATGLKIWIDLHGAPGSQNGFDNSGHRISTPGWQSGNTVKQTLAVLETITQKYAQPSYQDVVVAIELLNEPLGSALNYDELRQFYRDGFGQVRAVSDTPVMLHDAFNAPSTWNGFLSVSDGNAQNGMSLPTLLLRTQRNERMIYLTQESHHGPSRIPSLLQ
jgi:glucan 1,3-beta-glucosidase